jgi:nanoRNase/pAp phosphatase (c-di-AMP/oligoRNAs hydrolase)
VANAPVSAAVQETRAEAILGREVRGAFAVSYVADAAHPDAIPQAADELVRLEGVSAAVVCGECDGSVRLSGRARDERVHMGRAMEATLSAYGDGDGGGHARMGGGQIPRTETDRRTLVDRLFDALDGAAAPRDRNTDTDRDTDPGSSGPDRGSPSGSEPEPEPEPDAEPGSEPDAATDTDLVGA